MSGKTVAFKTPARVSPIAASADAWVDKRPAQEPSREESPKPAPDIMKRFTIDVSEPLHKRIKAQCAMRGMKMADVIRDMLEREFTKA
jgi:ParG